MRVVVLCSQEVVSTPVKIVDMDFPLKNGKIFSMFSTCCLFVLVGNYSPILLILFGAN